MRRLILATAALAACTAAPAFAQTTPSITFYELPAYLGKSVTVREPVANLVSTSIARRAQSARVTGDWTVCTAADYEGSCRQLSANAPALAITGLAKKVVSLRPTETGNEEYSDGTSTSASTGTATATATGAISAARLADLDVGAGTEGQDTEYFARPQLSTQQVSAGSSDRTSADAFCRLAGYASSAYSGRARVQTSNLLDAGTGATARGYALRDVLCRR